MWKELIRTPTSTLLLNSEDLVLVTGLFCMITLTHSHILICLFIVGKEKMLEHIKAFIFKRNDLE